MDCEIRKALIEAAYHAHWKTEELYSGGCPSKWTEQKMSWCEGCGKCRHAKLYAYGTSPAEIEESNENYRYRLNCWIRYWSDDKVSIDWNDESDDNA